MIMSRTQTSDGKLIYEYEFHPCPKTSPSRDKKYQAWIRLQPCSCCGASPCHPAHQSILDPAGSRKADDKFVIPLCWDCHMVGEHGRGILTTWNDKSGHTFKDKHDLREYLAGLCARLHAEYEKQKGD